MVYFAHLNFLSTAPMSTPLDTQLAEHLDYVLAEIHDPYLGTSWHQARVLKKVDILPGKISITIELHYPAQGCHAHWKHIIAQGLAQRAHISPEEISITIQTRILAHAIQPGVQSVPGVKNIIAVGSGKGGVGKSTTSVNLALALALEGAKVGILDADIYGPSQPTMLGSQAEPVVNDTDKRMHPVERYGLQTMSIGYLIGEDQPVIWRGPMVSGALQQLTNQTIWADLDYLIVDLPPGTGDIHLTLVQKIPVSGAVVVTTPQDLALLDAQRASAMFQKVNINVLGIIENMSLHTCSECGHTEAIFGEGGGQRLADKSRVSLLGQLPLDKQIRTDADGGKPTVVASPESALALQYRECARRIAAQLSLRPRHYGNLFSTIVVESQ